MNLVDNSESRNNFMDLLAVADNYNKNDHMLKSLVKKNQENLNRRMLSPKFDEYGINKDKLLYINPLLRKKKSSKHLKFATSSSDKKIRRYSVKNYMENTTTKFKTCKNLLEAIKDDNDKKNKYKSKRNSVINIHKDMYLNSAIYNKYEEEFKDDLYKNNKKIFGNKKTKKLEKLKNFFDLIETHQKTQFESFLEPSKQNLDFIRSKKQKIFHTCVTYDKNDIFYNKKYKLIIDQIKSNNGNKNYSDVNIFKKSHASRFNHDNKSLFLESTRLNKIKSNPDNIFLKPKKKFNKNKNNNSIYIFNNNKQKDNLIRNNIHSFSDEKIKKNSSVNYYNNSLKNNNKNKKNLSRPQTAITTTSNKTTKFMISSPNETTDLCETSSISLVSDLNNFKTYNNSKKESKITSPKYRKKNKKIFYEMLSETLRKSSKMNKILKSKYNSKEKNEEIIEETKIRNLIKKKKTNLNKLVKELNLYYKEQKIDLEELVIKNTKKLFRHLQNMRQCLLMNEIANKVIVEDKILSKEVFIEDTLSKKLNNRIKTKSDKEFDALIKKRKILKNRMMKYKLKAENEVIKGLMKNEILYDFDDMKSLENMIYKYRTMKHH